LTAAAQSPEMSEMDYGEQCRLAVIDTFAQMGRLLDALDADAVNAALAEASVADLKLWQREARAAEGFFAEVARLIAHRLPKENFGA
jgi:hypothetical protein